VGCYIDFSNDKKDNKNKATFSKPDSDTGFSVKKSTRGWQKRCCLATLIAVVLSVFSATLVGGLLDINREPINYKTAPVRDRIHLLKQRLEDGSTKLEWDERHGWLPSMLKHLEVPVSSQTLVFSKTSVQNPRITPARPRAVYFNDDTYVGWVQYGDVLELSAVDPKQGGIFYVLTQEKTNHPEIIRDQGDCLTCHSSSKTKGVPGYLVRSVFASDDGRPHFGFGTTTTDHTTPMKKRYGGWYVSGTHGGMRHRGNVIAIDDRSNPIDPETGANITDLNKLFRVKPYLDKGSDIVALMVLEHQSQMHNLITNASFDCRHALYYQEIMNRALNRPIDHETDSTRSRIIASGEKLLQYMLFCDEYQLESPIEGASGFAKQFSSHGRRDDRGRSLRDFDLNQRMFRYPCSFLIYSDSFDELPAPLLAHVETRLINVLQGKDVSGKFGHLSSGDREAILKILMETKPGFREKVKAEGE